MNAASCSHCGKVHEPEGCRRTGPSRVGELLEAKYELVRVIGCGGMGEVYEARHRELNRRVAIKFLLPKYAAEQEFAIRFENEARAAAALEHENVAAVFDVGRTDDGARYLVMEFLAGEDCATLLSRHRTLTQVHAVRLALQVCRGLSAAHELGIVHRDLKPANLFLTKRGDDTDLIKILDFGISKQRVDGGSVASITGSVLGTPHYMSPEQAQGSRGLDHRTDIHALGVILYEFVSGKRPYDGSTPLEVAHRIATRTPEPLAKLCPTLAPSFIDCVAIAMARDRELRFASVSAMQQRLFEVLRDIESRPGEALGHTSEALETRPSLDQTNDGLAAVRPTTHIPVSPAARVEPVRIWTRPLVILAGIGLFALLCSWIGTARQRDRAGVSEMVRPSAVAAAVAPLQPSAASNHPPPAAATVGLSGQQQNRPDAERAPLVAVVPALAERAKQRVMPLPVVSAASAGPAPAIPASAANSAVESLAPPPLSAVVAQSSTPTTAPAPPLPSSKRELNRLSVDPLNPYR